MSLIISLISGLLFGIGLTISQMLDPNKVLNFLDVTGNWDPSLALVIGSALTVFSLGYFLLVKPRENPFLKQHFQLPNNNNIDKPLLLGASIFGLGWGLVGICPGPALANLSGGDPKMIAFIAIMLIGMQVSGLVTRLFKR